jgi:HlyD family secretion protein
MAVKLTKKRIIWGLGAVLAGSLVTYAIRPESLQVETAAVARGPLRVTLDEEGRTRVRDRYVIVAPVTGRVGRIEVEPGDSVMAGSAVARISPLPLDPRGREQAEAVLQAAQATRAAADAAVHQARAALIQARRNGQRVAALAAERALSPAEVEQAALAETTAVYGLSSAESRARAASHQVEEARGALLAATGAAGPSATVTVRSPVCGSVLAVPERSERIVPAGTPLLEVGDCSQLEAVVDILTTDAADVLPGALMLVNPWGDERPALEARVRRVEPAAFTKISTLGVEEQRVNVIADFASTPAGLGDGFRIEARIVVWEGTDVLQIPTSSLFRRADGWSAFVVEDGRARARAVSVGHRNAAVAEIMAGLTAGERVVRHPSDEIEEGVRVEGK